MIEQYEKQKKEATLKLAAIRMAYEKLLKVASNEKTKKILEKQEKLFNKLQIDNNYSKYTDKTNKNMEKLKDEIISSVEISQIKSDLENSIKDFSYETISFLISKLKKESMLQNAIKMLSTLYENTLYDVERYERLIEREREEERKKELQSEEIITSIIPSDEKSIKDERLEKYDSRIENSSKVLLQGPKRASIIDRIQGKDIFIEDIQYLYGLSVDLLILMDSDQYVSVNQQKSSDEFFIDSIDFPFFADEEMEYFQKKVFKKYGVNSIDELLEEYNKIRNQYYKKFSKLKSDQKSKYAFSKIDRYKIKNSLSHNASIDSILYKALENENLYFPPSKDQLIKMINRRIMNGKNFMLVSPNLKEETITSRPENYHQYDKILKDYKNLTKNMTIEEIADFYKVVQRYMAERNRYDKTEEEFEISKRQEAIMQKLFCEIVFYRKGMKYADSKQYDAEIKKIANEIFKEELKFSIYGYDQVTEKEHQERQETVYKEYLKYYAKQQDKKEVMKFSEFASKKYGIENIEEPKSLEEDLKGMKR